MQMYICEGPIHNFRPVSKLANYTFFCVAPSVVSNPSNQEVSKWTIRKTDKQVDRLKNKLASYTRFCRSSQFWPARQFWNELLEQPANKLASYYCVCVGSASFKAVQPASFEAGYYLSQQLWIEPAHFEAGQLASVEMGWVAIRALTYILGLKSFPVKNLCM